MKAADEKPPHDELKADVSLSEKFWKSIGKVIVQLRGLREGKLGKSVGKLIVLLRALREGGVKDRLLLVVIGSLSIWCLSWSFETGTGLVKDGMAWMNGPSPRRFTDRDGKSILVYARDMDSGGPSERGLFGGNNNEWWDEYIEKWERTHVQEKDRRGRFQERIREESIREAIKNWGKRASRIDHLLLNPRKRWPHYGLIQEWSGKAGLLLAALWLLAWVLTGKKQNKLTE